MASARYTALPTSHSASTDANRELDDAFDSDHEDDVPETTPLTHHHTESTGSHYGRPSVVPVTYDFERDYDVPPPGSPPRPSAVAIPNEHGNSNGRIPSEPVRPPILQPSFLRRTIGAILPTHYAPLPSGESSHGRTVGGGTENDGVFANVMAKPSRPRLRHAPNGDVQMVPEETQKEPPPSYADAQADAVPPYWETTIHAPSGLGIGSDMIIDDLPSGSVFIFLANTFISFFFQFIGFLLTYLLHTSHAAKYGSRAGLGLTLIQYGFFSRNAQGGDDANWEGPSPALPTGSPSSPSAPMPEDSPAIGATSSELVSFVLMSLGWFLLLTSAIGFWRVKRWEFSIRSSARRMPVTPEDLERDLAIRRNIEQVFGIRMGAVQEDEDEGDSEEDEEIQRTMVLTSANGVDGQSVIPDEAMLENARFARLLRDAGFI